jgi:thioredoxin-related protein
VDGIKQKYGRQIQVVYVSMDQQKGKEIAKQYQIVGTPTILLLDRDGARVNILRGSLPPPLIEQAVLDLLAE